jgi:hypothetical protein
MEVPVKPRRPPSLPLVCVVCPDHSSFSVLRGTPMASTKNTQFQKAKVLPFCHLAGLLRKSPSCPFYKECNSHNVKCQNPKVKSMPKIK